MRTVVAALTGYLLGCFATAYYLVRLRTGSDVRATGSGNAGARNVLRTRGAPEAAITLMVDAVKGAVAVLIAGRLTSSPLAPGLALVAVVAGHIWPVQLHFRGGKGAATLVGAMLVLSPITAALGALVTALTLGATRKLTASGLAGIAAGPIAMAATGASASLVLFTSAACALVLAAHHPGFRRMSMIPQGER